MALLSWADRTRVRHVCALGYEDGDKESKAFFDNLPFGKPANDRLVRVHLGRHSKRRKKESPYGVDEKGRLTLNGRLVSDGGYRRGLLTDLEA